MPGGYPSCCWFQKAENAPPSRRGTSLIAPPVTPVMVISWALMPACRHGVRSQQGGVTGGGRCERNDRV